MRGSSREPAAAHRAAAIAGHRKGTACPPRQPPPSRSRARPSPSSS
ncbi:hypothetical protein [Lysobacter gummosus]